MSTAITKDTLVEGVTVPDVMNAGASTELSTSVGTDMVVGGVALSPGSSLDHYIRTVNAIPALSAERERTLAITYRRDDNLEAARELVMSQLSFVVHIARGYKGYGLSLSDLIQEGNIGLMKAVKQFDPHRGVRFITFAVHWIRAEMYEFVIRNWRIVKIATTKAQRKLFFGLRKSRKRLGLMDRNELEEAARHFDVKVDDVALMDSRLNGADLSYDPMVSQDGDSGENTSVPAEFIASDEDDPAVMLEQADTHTHKTRALGKALSVLDKRSADIVRSRWLLAPDEQKSTLQDLAGRYGISVERVRQIEQVAMKKIRVSLEQALPALA